MMFGARMIGIRIVFSCVYAGILVFSGDSLHPNFKKQHEEEQVSNW